MTRSGPNAIHTHHVSAWAVLARQLNNAVLILLAGTAVLSYFLGDHTQALIIGVILMASIGLGFFNEYRAEQAAAALHSQVHHSATVRRDGKFISIDVANLVPGDVIRLSLGEAVPADVRLMEATAFECNESILSGESTGSEKSPKPVAAGAALTDLIDLAFMGTIVSAGEAAAVVYATGKDAQFGRIAAGLGERQPETDFQAGLRKFSYLLLRVAIVLTVMILITNLLLRRPVIDSVLFALAIAVGITPQLLPAVVSASLATGSRRLAKAKVLVKRLVCIEDLGDIDILITDKTGTFTQGRISLVDTVNPSGAHTDSVLRSGPAGLRCRPGRRRWRHQSVGRRALGTPRSQRPWVAPRTGLPVCRSTIRGGRRRRWLTMTANGFWWSRAHPSRCWPGARPHPRRRSRPWPRCSAPAAGWLPWRSKPRRADHHHP